MPSWMNLFNGSNQNQQQQQPAQPEPSPQAPATPPAKDPGFQQPADHDPNNNQQQAKSPLDQYGELFNIEPEKDAQGNPVQKPTGDEPFFNMDEEKFQATVNKMNFIPESAQETLKKVQEGDMSALPELMNQMVRYGYSQNVNLTRHMMEDLGKGVTSRVNQSVPDKFQELQVAGALQGNQSLNHPAIKPVATALAQQVRAKYPNATPQEVQEQVVGFIKTMGQSLNEPADSDRENQQQPNRYDWEGLFGL